VVIICGRLGERIRREAARCDYQQNSEADH